MSRNSFGNRRGLGGNRLIIGIVAWLVLVGAGAACTWYGWFRPGSGSDESSAEATAAAELPTPEQGGGDQ